MTCLHLERRIPGAVAMRGAPRVHLVAAAAAAMMFVVTLCHTENVKHARFALCLLEGATTAASILDFRRTLKGVFADVTRQTV